MSDRTRESAFWAEAVYDALMPGLDLDFAGQKYRVLHVQRGESGYFGAIVQKVGTAELIVAHRGTETTLRELIGDGGADASMVLLQVNPQAADARTLTRLALAIAEKLRQRGYETDVRQVGHSLGGFHAQMMAVEFGLEAETFNAYGAQGLLTRPPRPETRIVNHVRATDAVAAANGHIGEVRIYATPEDVRRLVPAGYLRGNLTLERSPVQVASIEAHAISNFTREGLISAENVAHYQRNRDVFDQYRDDVRSIRMSFTQALAFYADGMRRQVRQETEKARTRVYMDLLPPDALRGLPMFNDASDPTRAMPAPDAPPRPSDRFQPSMHRPEIRPTADIGRDPHHPDHALYRQISEAVQRMCQRYGFHPSPEQRERTVLRLAVAVREDPAMKRVDEVVPSRSPDGAIGERLLAVYKPFGDSAPFFHVQIDAAEAARTPAELSIERLHALRQQPPSPQPIQRHELEHAPALRMS